MFFCSKVLNYAKVKELARDLGTVDLSCPTIENDPDIAAALALAIFQNQNITYDELKAAATRRKVQVSGKNIIG